MVAMTRSLFWPSLSAAIALLILLSLGTWQLQRLAWKQDLIASIKARSTAEPLTLEEAIRRYAAGEDVEFFPLRLRGRFDHANEKHLYRVETGKAGWRILTPLHTRQGRIVMVDRGFVPDELKAPERRKEGLLEGEREVIGQLRYAAGQGMFTPDNVPQENIWYWPDLRAMARESGISRERLVPFYVEDRNKAVPGGWPRGAPRNAELPNRHLEYAITWYSLALALIGVYVAYVRTALKKR
ncbi:MAG: SURF1 family protein [Alphaproteobacteria bacterium]|nr:MAG: SURF1 family protein [Alphaproteobacteria bacterium]